VRAVDAWSALVHRHRWAVLVLALALLVPAALWGAGTHDRLSDGALAPSDSEAVQAAEVARAAPGMAGGGDAVLVYRAGDGGGFGDPDFDAAVRESLAALPQDLVAEAAQPWAAPDGGDGAALVSRDGRSVAAPLRLTTEDADEQEAAVRRIADAAEVPSLEAAGVELDVGGAAAVRVDLKDRAAEDLIRAEVVTFPLLMVLLVWVFRGVVAAVLPLLVGGVAVAGSTAVLGALATVTEVSTLSLNVVTMLGLGLAVDYALFMVARFREESALGAAVPDALAATMRTAGRTVLVSGVAVGVALASLTVFDVGSLRSLGLAGTAVTMLCMVTALTVLPALLAVLGRRVDALPAGRRVRGEAAVPGSRVWARIASATMRRPIRHLVATAALLVVFGLPFLGVHYVQIGTWSLPQDASARAASTAVEEDLPGLDQPTATVVLTGGGASAESPATAGYLREVQGVPDVTDARVVGGDADSVVVAVRSDAPHESEKADAIVRELRGLEPPEGTSALVGGPTAELRDVLDSIGGDLPVMLLVMVGSMMLLLCAALGSVVLPVKAVLVGALSLTASFGVVVWGFQDGGLAGLLGFEAPPGIDPAVLIVVFAIAFGLSMDYELFLLSRVREAWLRGSDNTASVEEGVRRTAGLVTGAAVLLATVFAAMGAASLVAVQMVGVGLFVAVLLDATVVRGVLVPAAMRLMGRANWWLPAPLLFLRRGRPPEDVPEAAPPEKESVSVTKE
jgi:RND superfamily putative drug exporter